MWNLSENGSRVRCRKLNTLPSLLVTTDRIFEIRILQLSRCWIQSFFILMLPLGPSGKGDCYSKSCSARLMPESCFLRNLQIFRLAGIPNSLQTYWRSTCFVSCLVLKADTREECARNWTTLPSGPDSGSIKSEGVAGRFHPKELWVMLQRIPMYRKMTDRIAFF